MKPTPTEYKGIIFRSKSEAVFARALDLSERVLAWFYEPSSEQVHPWDFEVILAEYCWSGDRMRFCKGSGGGFVLIEYKPAEPTMSYVRQLTEKVRPHVRQVLSRPAPHRCNIDSYIVHGAPWSGPREDAPIRSGCSYVCYPIFSGHDGYGWGNFEPVMDCGRDRPYSHRHSIQDILGIDERIAQEAKQYRFDLAERVS